MNYAKIGAVSFVLWGLLHIVGGTAILMAVGESPANGFAVYEESTAAYTELAGSVLGNLAYSFIWIGVVVTFVGVRYNWHNSQAGLMLNTALVGLTDLGLIIFLILPGFVGWGEASPGLVLFAAGAIFGGIACQSSDGE
jgi:uncharacterized iron-regulated membrane protein